MPDNKLLLILLLSASLTLGTPAGDRISVKKRANNLPVISGDEDVASLQMLKTKKWPRYEVKQVEAWGPNNNPFNKNKDVQNNQAENPEKRSQPRSFSDQQSSFSQFSNFNGNILSKSDQSHQALEDGNLLAAYHRANIEQANQGQQPTHQEVTELDIPNENIHKKILNKNGQTLELNQANNSPLQFGGANQMPPHFMAANQEPAGFGAANGFQAPQFDSANEMEAMLMPSANQNGVQFESPADLAQKRSQDDEDKVRTAEELSKYILQTGDEEGVANYFQQLIVEGQMDEYEALDYLNLIKSMLTIEKDSEFELEREEEREREAQLILDFSDYLDLKYQNGEIPSHLYRGLKGKLMESVIEHAAADPQFLAAEQQPAAAMLRRR